MIYKNYIDFMQRENKKEKDEIISNLEKALDDIKIRGL